MRVRPRPQRKRREDEQGRRKGWEGEKGGIGQGMGNKWVRKGKEYREGVRPSLRSSVRRPSVRLIGEIGIREAKVNSLTGVHC